MYNFFELFNILT